MKEDSKKREKSGQRFRNSKHSKTDETYKTAVEKLKSVKDNKRLKKLESDIKISQDETKKSNYSLRCYIKQKCKMVTFLFVIYIVIFVTFVSMPFVHNHTRVVSKNETEQERSIT